MTHILLDSPAQYSSRFTTVARPRFRTCCRSPSHPRLDIQRSAHSKLKRKPYTKCPESPYPHALHICTQGSRGRREVTCQEHKLSRGHSRGILLPALCVTLGIALGVFSNPALAFTIHQEPENALSFPTWVIHISSVVEWAIAMALVWKYAEVTGNPKWKGLTWGMMPLLGGALCACTYHFFYNSSDLDFLVAVQASLTWIGNATCAAAAYRIYRSAQEEGAT